MQHEYVRLKSQSMRTIGGTSLKAIGAWRRRAPGHARSDVDTRPRVALPRRAVGKKEGLPSHCARWQVLRGSVVATVYYLLRSTLCFAIALPFGSILLRLWKARAGKSYSLEKGCLQSEQR